MTTEAVARPSEERRASVVLIGVVVLGALARVLAHHGVHYEAGDEGVYTHRACHLARHGLGSYTSFVHDYLTHANVRLYPSPLRWGWFVLAALASKVLGCGSSAVAWVSTLSGIGLLIVTGLMVRRVFGPWHAVVATTFVAASPLQLHLGRRGLSDELVCLLSLAAIWAVFEYAGRRTTARLLVGIAVLACGFAAKEIFFMLYPLLGLRLVIDWFRGRPDLRDVLLLVVPPLLSYAGFTLITRDPSAFWQVLPKSLGASSNSYGEMYQNGAPHRLLLDLFVLSPIVFLAGVASTGLLIDRRNVAARWAAAAVPLVIAPFAVIRVESVRYVAVADVLLCILATWGILAALRSRHWAWVALVVVVTVAANAWIFWTVSVTANVYDPVTARLLAALHMIP